MKALIPLLALLSMTLHAEALNLNQLQGEKRYEYLSPRSLREVCVVPQKLSTGSYSKKDLKTENALCEYNFYTNMGICPKYNSTNPAILLLEPNDKYTKAQIDASSCQVKKMGVKTEAKFKQSITCSYTPSNLAYYHVSRALGNVGRVPVSVIRSMDIDIHRQLTRKANKHLENSRAEIAKSWSLFDKVHQRPSEHPLIFEQTENQIYGVLVDNVKNENYYSDVSGTGDYSSRYQRFLKLPAYQRVSSSRSAVELAGSSEFTKAAALITQIKDTGDMILIDTLLNQQDRIGNVHYKFYWYIASGGTIVREKSDAEWVDDKLVIPAAEKQAMAGKTAALVKEMILKDNDCGVNKTNMMRKVSALERVRHFSYETYRKFLAFERTLAAPATQAYFMDELLFSESDYCSLVQNAEKAKEILTSSCRSGRLQFDVDLEDYLPGKRPGPHSCSP